MFAVTASRRVSAWVRAAPDGPVRILHQGPHATYFDVSGRCVGLITPAATRVPNALTLGFSRECTFTPKSAYVEGGLLHCNSRPLVVGRIVDVRAPRIDVVDPAHATGPAITSAPPQPVVAGLVRKVVPGAPLSRDLVRSLIGDGEGLTPLGDDVLCGWIAALHAARRLDPQIASWITESSHRTTLLSATLLDCAWHGEVIPEFGHWLSALGTPEEPTARAALQAIGHTSGTGMWWGATLALHQLSDERRAA